jgi:dinuclear metal center YbgI/SA1388 family protein
MTGLAECTAFLDAVLNTSAVADYDRALNGLQLANSGRVSRVAAAVDYSTETVRRAIETNAHLLIVHHGMFWGGSRPIVAAHYDRLRLAIMNDLAVYSSHLPLDLHADLGNNVRLARQLGLEPSGGFGQFRSLDIGVCGRADLPTVELLGRVQEFARAWGSEVVSTPHTPERRTRHWAILTGAGASTDSLIEAAERGVDTLIVGEGPHHTAVEAREGGLVVMYAGHYATETLGVQALAVELERQFSLPWSFIHLPTGL